MEIIKGKKVIFGNYNETEAFESDVPNGDLNLFKLVLLCIFKKGFKSYLCDTIKYALMHSECYRGTYASDVIIFKGCFDYSFIFKKEEK